MRFLKKLFILLVVIIFVSGGCLFYAFKIEPYRLVVNQFDLNEKTKERLKIVQFSDTHIKEDFTYKNLKKIVRLINEQKADIVIFTGDLYDHYAKYHDDENIIKELTDIDAKYEKIAIWGNRDYGGGAVRQYENIMTQAGFTLLKNTNHYVTTQTNQSILLTGLDDSMLGNPDMPDSYIHNDSSYRVLLTHEPDTIDKLDVSQYDLILSGHSHGGQINIPLIPMINQKAVSSTELAIKYTGGMYELESNKKIYVNTGIGTTHISARFGVVPEITVFQLYE